MNARTAAAAPTRAKHIDPSDVMAEQPKHCEDCGAVIISLLVNYADSTRKWVPAKWDSTVRAWIPHTCETARTEL